MTKTKSQRKQSVHIILQEKGGIGKSFLSSILLQYLTDQGHPVVGIDTDPKNASLEAYKSLNVEKLHIMNGDGIDIEKFDDLLIKIDETNLDYVVDIGSSNFIGFNEYVTSEDTYNLIQEMGAKVYLHIIVVGGEAMTHTLNGLNNIVSGEVPKDSVIIWENEHFGKLHETKSVMDSDIIKSLADKIHGSVVLEQEKNSLVTNSMISMQKKHYTFADVPQSTKFNFVKKRRLENHKNHLWAKFASVLPDTVNPEAS